MLCISATAVQVPTDVVTAHCECVNPLSVNGITVVAFGKHCIFRQCGSKFGIQVPACEILCSFSIWCFVQYVLRKIFADYVTNAQQDLTVITFKHSLKIDYNLGSPRCKQFNIYSWNKRTFNRFSTVHVVEPSLELHCFVCVNRQRIFNVLVYRNRFNKFFRRCNAIDVQCNCNFSSNRRVGFTGQRHIVVLAVNVYAKSVFIQFVSTAGNYTAIVECNVTATRQSHCSKVAFIYTLNAVSNDKIAFAVLYICNDYISGLILDSYCLTFEQLTNSCCFVIRFKCSAHVNVVVACEDVTYNFAVTVLNCYSTINYACGEQRTGNCNITWYCNVEVIVSCIIWEYKYARFHINISDSCNSFFPSYFEFSCGRIDHHKLTFSLPRMGCVRCHAIVIYGQQCGIP